MKLTENNKRPTTVRPVNVQRDAPRTPTFARTKELVAQQRSPMTAGPKAGQVRFGEFKARPVPKSTYERPSKRKAAKGLLNKSGASCAEESISEHVFQSCSEDEVEAVVSILKYGSEPEETKENKNPNVSAIQHCLPFPKFSLGQRQSSNKQESKLTFVPKVQNTAPA